MVNKQYLQKNVCHFNLKLTGKVFTSKLNIWHRFTYNGVLYKFPASIVEGQNLFQMRKILRKITFANLLLSYLRYQKDMYKSKYFNITEKKIFLDQVFSDWKNNYL